MFSKEKKRKPFDFDVNIDRNLSEEKILELNLSYNKTYVPLKKKEKTTFPFALFGEIMISIWKTIQIILLRKALNTMLVPSWLISILKKLYEIRKL